MIENIVGRLFEYNTWANLKIIEACSALSDEQLDAQPVSATKGTIRRTLRHLLASQEEYISLLSGGNYNSDWQAMPTLAACVESATRTGQALLALAQDFPQTRVENDGYRIEPWVLVVLTINHAQEHREQFSSMLSALGFTPPELNGWIYGAATNAFFEPEHASSDTVSPK